jgi:hypothetical protein
MTLQDDLDRIGIDDSWTSCQFDALGRSGARGVRGAGHEDQFGMTDQRARGPRYRDSDDPRVALRQLAGHLDELLRIVGDVRASRLRQLADARPARHDPATPESPGPNRRARAVPDL